tara:strand:- start:5175 stop:5858 length:684 start_codon:yes stop_codon:yes gene_type:complete
MSDNEKTIGVRLQQLQRKVTDAGDTFKQTMIESFNDQYRNGRTLSPRQTDLLNEWEAQFSDDHINALIQYKEQYAGSEQMQNLFKLALQYYKDSPPYFSAVISKYRDWHQDDANEGKLYIPLHHTFIKMTQNRHFQSYRKELLTLPRYSPGDLVEGRQGKSLSGNLYMIVQPTGRARSARGSKEYLSVRLVQPQYSRGWRKGADNLIQYVEEGYVKKFKMKGKETNV